ncbi:hypothetical protein [Peribacillus butanolivorans]
MPNEQIGLLGNQKTGYMQGVASIGNLLVTIIVIREYSYHL